MSGRKGLGVKADDLIDRLEANAYIEVGRATRKRVKKRNARSLTSLRSALSGIFC
ncbi:MAG: hypothetical protein UZ17_ACD001000329 [Acidobacteria bacterium OLB17]|nr:MAG: hypothetical protein UZ17_ACD001000329 [Acidobacteria bacterium OLB17]